MSDSFFGFNTTLPGDDDDGLNDDDSEFEYDALNDETFGSAIKGDWEDLHENLVQLERTITGGGGEDDDDNDDEDDDDLRRLPVQQQQQQQHHRNNSSNSAAHKDSLRNDFHSLEQDLLRLGLRNIPAANDDDCESRITLDPSVWAPPTPAPPPVPRSIPNTGPGHGHSLFGMPPDAMRRHPMSQFGGGMPPVPPMMGGGGGPKMCTLEDIERSMRSQPQQQQQQSNGHLMDTSGSTTVSHNQQQSNHNDSLRNLFPQQQSGGGPLNAPSRLPPGFGPQQQQQQPPPPPHMAGGHHPQQPPNNFGPPHPPFPLNHRPGPQNFPLMGPPHGPPMHGGPPGPPGPHPHQMPPGPHSPNHYNKRLVMEIQQTHPLLGYHRMNHPGMHPMHPMFMQQQQGQPPHPGQHHHPHHPQGGPPPMPPPHGMPPHPMQMPGGHMMNGGGGGPNGPAGMKQRGYSPMGGARDGNLSLTRQLMNGGGNGEEEEKARDEYRSLMTPRDKQWLIGIQLMQLNTETPYIDDYYYTVYKERRMKGRRENKFHTDNQLNHPLTQPQGHAQLVLQSIGNRNNNKGVFSNNRDGGRDRKGSESSRGGGTNGNEKGGQEHHQQQQQQQQQHQQTPRTYTPLQFENSLGKLQCGSVTAPRKIIDMEIMAQEAGSGGAGNLPPAMEVTAQRKCRQMLLHIETLYRVVLKLEDLKNPTAIEAFSLLREKKERERKATEAHQQAEREAAAAAVATTEGGAPTPTVVTTTVTRAPVGGGRLNIDSVLSEDKSRIGEETLEDLLRVLSAGLVPEKVIGMMTVRKGRTLLVRAMAQVEDMELAWQAWMGILMAVPLAMKKDREEAETQLLTFWPVLKKHADKVDLKQLLVLCQAVEQKGAVLLSTKFIVGAIILLINRAEDLFKNATNTINIAERREWNVMLGGLCTVAEAVIEGKQTKQPSVKQLCLLEKVVTNLLRFPDLDKTIGFMQALSCHGLEEVA